MPQWMPWNLGNFQGLGNVGLSPLGSFKVGSTT